VRAVADERPFPGSAAALDTLRARMETHLSVLLEREAALSPLMTPCRFEWRFEDAELLGSFDPPVALTGTLDRLDVSPDGRDLVVVDYKRSGADFRPNADVVKRLQLPLYGLMAARERGGGARAAGGFYLGFLADRRDGGVRSPCRTSTRSTPPAGS
jgi:RecB family exonuclease